MAHVLNRTAQQSLGQASTSGFVPCRSTRQLVRCPKKSKRTLVTSHSSRARKYDRVVAQVCSRSMPASLLAPTSCILYHRFAFITKALYHRFIYACMLPTGSRRWGAFNVHIDKRKQQQRQQLVRRGGLRCHRRGCWTCRLRGSAGSCSHGLQDAAAHAEPGQNCVAGERLHTARWPICCIATHMNQRKPHDDLFSHPFMRKWRTSPEALSQAF